MAGSAKGSPQRRRRKPLRPELLERRLNELVETFDISTLMPDPLQLVLPYREIRDQEIAGLLASAFAYGRATVVVSNVGGVLEKMQPSPHAYLEAFDRREAMRRFAGFSHRFHKTADLVALLECVAGVIRTHGSLGSLFERCYDGKDRDVGPSLARFVEQVLAVGGHGLEATQRSLRYLLTSPNDGSACKRMNLYLRWMVRRTSPDLGLWTFVDPAKLVVPLDTHVHRIATFLGLNDRKAADWKSARAITDRLARFDPSDPVRYDFALCRLGILDLCSVRPRAENCEVCHLRDVCRFPVTAPNF